MAAARQGSSHAFGELYRAHAGWVAQLARASREAHAVADVVQGVFTRALANLDRLRHPARFGARLRTIADHVIVDHHRTAGRSRPLDAAAAHEIECRSSPPDAIAEAKELADSLRRSVAGLSTRDATAIALVSSHGLSPAELGSALGVSGGAAKVVLYRAPQPAPDRAPIAAIVTVTVTASPDAGRLPASLTSPDGRAVVRSLRRRLERSGFPPGLRITEPRSEGLEVTATPPDVTDREAFCPTTPTSPVTARRYLAARIDRRVLRRGRSCG